jgi:hypothetical protein
MILFDLDTDSRWKSYKFNSKLILNETSVHVINNAPRFNFVQLPRRDWVVHKYELLKSELFKNLGARDPHTIPRALYNVGSADKSTFIRKNYNGTRYVSRNIQVDEKIDTYNTLKPGISYNIMEFQHRFIDMTYYFYTTKITKCDVLVSDLKVDHWYKGRYAEWSNRIGELCKILQS